MKRAVSILALCAAACSSDSRPRSDAGPGVDTSGGGGMDALVHPDAMEDPPDSGVDVDSGIVRDPMCPAGAFWVHTVRGSIVEESGAPSTGARAQLCVRTAPNDVLICLRPLEVQADGTFEIAVPANARCVREHTMRVVQPTGDRTVGYCALDLSSNADVITVAAPFKVYTTARPAALPPLGDGSISRTIAFPGGLEIDLIPDHYFPGAGTYDDLAVATIPAANTTECIQAGEAAFDGIFSFSPEGDVNMGRVVMRLPNVAGLAANTPVDVYVLGSLACTDDNGELLTEGEWTKIESSAVSADGMIIPVTPGAPCLSWIAYRRQ